MFLCTQAYGLAELHRDASNGHAEVVHWLIEKGADINKQSSDGYTALHLAAVANRVQTIKHLIAEGADLSIANQVQ